ncbi:MAG: PSD1 domain-containing protein [Planctomycetales bacterium]|nr:PSD1 domain-containing protein [Planctomycetales bacterium]
MRVFLLFLIVAMTCVQTGSWRPRSLQADETAVSVETSQPMTAADLEYFEKKVRPLLHEHCYSCHSAEAETLQGGLRLDTRAGLHGGGDSGPSVVPGQAEASLLIASIRYADEGYPMPPSGKMSEAEIAELTRWVERGAPFPDTPTDDSLQPRGLDIEAGRQFWSFQPLQPAALPDVKNPAWPRQRIDWFVLAAQERAGLEPTAAADRATLIRRLSFDLTGLPPTAAQVQQFVADDSPQAYERLVSSLLQSPAYGQRWARVWLDLARYTDTTASWLDSTAQAHLYRDWVVRTLNEDIPYDNFVHRQLATDMMPETGPEDLPALGFLALSPTYWKELQLPCDIIKVIVADEWEERVDALSRTFLGLTVACARCHDHKFDPIGMEDYYALAGVVASCRLSQKPLIEEAAYEPVKQVKSEVEKLDAEVDKLKKQKPVPQEEIDQLLAKRQNLIQSTPLYDTPLANVVSEESLYVLPAGETMQDGTRLDYRPGPQDLNLFIRGNPNRLGPVVPRRFISVLSDDTPRRFQQGSGRWELAQAITNEAGPLTARVIVNRIWAAHFGRGLVTTPSNFGQLGERPTHPELLDDLAARFVAHNWSLKWLHREIVLSATYRQGSQRAAAQEQLDPDNRWLGRMNPQRLNFEAWRDAILTASGELDPRLDGRSTPLDDPENKRRTLYATIHRHEMSQVLQLHDFPDANAHSEQRVHTTTALQGLYLLNSSFIADQATALAQRLVAEAPGDIERQIDLAHWRLFSRPATAEEQKLGQAFLGEQAADPRSDAWRQYAHALLGCNELLFVD